MGWESDVCCVCVCDFSPIFLCVCTTSLCTHSLLLTFLHNIFSSINNHKTIYNHYSSPESLIPNKTFLFSFLIFPFYFVFFFSPYILFCERFSKNPCTFQYEHNSNTVCVCGSARSICVTLMKILLPFIRARYRNKIRMTGKGRKWVLLSVQHTFYIIASGMFVSLDLRFASIDFLHYLKEQFVRKAARNLLNVRFDHVVRFFLVDAVGGR